MPSSNPRYRNPKKRRAMRVRIMRRGDPCALCGKPIDYTLPRGHPMAYELDEIVPISRGGSPIDPDNLQATHAICNRRKGNRMPDMGLIDVVAWAGTRHSLASARLW